MPNPFTRSPSLRGSKHSKIPDIANQPLNTLLPCNKDDSPHSHPFYLTRTAVLSIGETERPPWEAVTKQVGVKCELRLQGLFFFFNKMIEMVMLAAPE